MKVMELDDLKKVDETKKTDSKVEKKNFEKRHDRDRRPQRLITVLEAFKGKDVVVKMRDKEIISGRIEEVSQYEIIVKGGNGLPIIIMKHAVNQISLKG